MSRSIVGILTLAAIGALAPAACDDDVIAPEGPFTFQIVRQVNGGTRDLVAPGEDLRLTTGQRVLFRVQVLDRRGNPVPDQSETEAENGNPQVLEMLDAVLDGEDRETRFTFRALARGLSIVSFVNAEIELLRSVVVRVED